MLNTNNESAMSVEARKAALELSAFIEKCPSMFHTTAEISDRLKNAGFTFLPEGEAWSVERGGKYFEVYGGAIDYTCFDKPLGLAGRVLVREGGCIESRLYDSARDVALIPSLAIHMDRSVNEKFSPNRQTDLMPLFRLRLFWLWKTTATYRCIAVSTTKRLDRTPSRALCPRCCAIRLSA